MKEATERSIFRWIHIVFGIPISVTFMIHLRTLDTMPPRSIRLLPCSSFRDYGCGKATSFDDSFLRTELRDYNRTKIGGINIQ